nr:hypothetical protein BaRGS_008624 [Batillaria attramentaria]
MPPLLSGFVAGLLSPPLAATSGIIAGAVLLMVAVSAGVAFLAHRRIQASKRQRRQQNPAEPAVTVPLNPPFRGVQEEGSPCLQENTWHIFQIPAYAKKLADDKADVEKPELSPVDNPGKKPPDDSGGTSTANPGLIVGIVTAALVCSAGVLVALVYRIHKHMRTDGQTPLPTEEQPEDAEPEHEPEPETPGDRPVEEEGQEGPNAL